jgi:hypothetical protein
LCQQGFSQFGWKEKPFEIIPALFKGKIQTQAGNPEKFRGLQNQLVFQLRMFTTKPIH